MDQRFRPRVAGAPGGLGYGYAALCRGVGGTLGSTTTGRANSFNAAVFSLTFYGVVFPWLLRTILVLLPALWGMRRSLQQTSLPLLRTMVGAVAIVMLTAWTAKGVESSVTFGRHVIPPDAGEKTRYVARRSYRW